LGAPVVELAQLAVGQGLGSVWCGALEQTWRPRPRDHALRDLACCRTGQNKIIVAANASEAFELLSKELRNVAKEDPLASSDSSSDGDSDGEDDSDEDDSDDEPIEDILRLASKFVAGEMTSEDEEALRKSLMRMEQHTAVPSGPRSAVGTRLDSPFLLKKPKPPLLLSAGYKRKMWLVGEMFVGDSGAALRSYWLAHVRGGRFEVRLHVATCCL
jgi:hypothetical protein